MTPEELNKACEFLEARLYPTVKVLNEDLVDVIDRWELIDEFREAMGAVIKESLTTELKKKMIIEWDDKGSIDISVPDGEAKTVEVVGVLEMCKLVLFENKQQKEETI